MSILRAVLPHEPLRLSAACSPPHSPQSLSAENMEGRAFIPQREGVAAAHLAGGATGVEVGAAGSGDTVHSTAGVDGSAAGSEMAGLIGADMPDLGWGSVGGLGGNAVGERSGIWR